MSEMVERVARAIAEAPDPQAWETVARAAIEAMREPTMKMIMAGERHVPDSDVPGCDGSDFCPDIWQAMIDEALCARLPPA